MLRSSERFAFSKQTKPLVESLLLGVFDDALCIEWLDGSALDIECGIDLIVRLTSGQPLTVQVKTSPSDYTTVTIETSSVDRSGNPKPADWSACLAQYYMVVYAEDCMTADRWCLLSFPALALATACGDLEWGYRSNREGYSDFAYIEWRTLRLLAPQTVVACGGEWSP